MRLIKTGKHRKAFEVLASTRSAQAAVMILAPGQSTGELENEHPRSEQWLFVAAGTGMARVGTHRVRLQPGTLLLIEKGEVHQIVNTGRRSLRTLNFYAPPAYRSDGELRG